MTPGGLVADAARVSGLPLRLGSGRLQQGGHFVTVARTPDLGEDTLRPKEQTFIDLVRSERASRKKVWVYVQYTGRYDVEARLERLLAEAGCGVGVLRPSVPLNRRKEWIARHGWKLDVVISRPGLVDTALDLVDEAGRRNFPTLVFYESGYNLFTLRQASRRAWRIGQTKPCRVVYL
jgi:hypothetical protein